MQDLVVNVDISNIQYSLDKMMETATELGFDGEEFDSLGFYLNESKCNAGACAINSNYFKNLDKAYNGYSNMLVDKFKCHPVIKERVIPQVQYI